MLVLVLIAAATATAAKDPPPSAGKKGPPMLIDAQALHSQLENPKLRLVDVRPRDEYEAGHIPGAVWADIKAWQDQGRKPGGFHDKQGWAVLVGSLGIAADEPTVVVYGGSITDAARMWWLLKYAGLRDVRLLDGGWTHWRLADGPVQRDVPQVKPQAFVPRFQADRLDEIDTLKKAIAQGDRQVVDTRSRAEYTGEQARGPRGGRIPDATHLEWKELLAEDGRFKKPDELRRLFKSRGIAPDGKAVTCY